MNLWGNTIQHITVSEKERHMGQGGRGWKGGSKGESKRGRRGGRGRESWKGEEGAGLTGAGLCALPLARTHPQGRCGMWDGVGVSYERGAPSL